MTDSWREWPVSVVVLAKESCDSKTRLKLERGEACRAALWLAASTVRTARMAGCVGSVLVVTSDEAIAADATAAGAHVVREHRPLGMNRAAALGRSQALSASPAAPVATLVADLPQLRPEHLDEVIAEFRERRAPLFVADQHGVGTTFLIHGPEQAPGIGFGHESAVMHRRLGYLEALTAARGLRADLDTPEDLAALGGLANLGPLAWRTRPPWVQPSAGARVR